MTTLENLEARIIALELANIELKRKSGILCYNIGCENSPRGKLLHCTRCLHEPLTFTPRTELEYHGMIKITPQ